MVKNPPAMRETWVRSLGWEDPLEEGMAEVRGSDERTYPASEARGSGWEEQPHA